MSFLMAWLLVVGVVGGFLGIITFIIMWREIGPWVYDKLTERNIVSGNMNYWEVEQAWNIFGGIILAFLASLVVAAALVDATNSETSGVDNAPDKVIEYPVE